MRACVRGPSLYLCASVVRVRVRVCVRVCVSVGDRVQFSVLRAPCMVCTYVLFVFVFVVVVVFVFVWVIVCSAPCACSVYGVMVYVCVCVAHLRETAHVPNLANHK